MKHVLLIEDDPFLSDLTSTKLSDEAITIHSAQSAEAAEKILSSEVIHLILLDLELPGMSGMEYFSHLKSSSTFKHIPVIVFSNNDSKDQITQCKSAGVDDYFVKVNTDYEELRKVVNKHLT